MTAGISSNEKLGIERQYEIEKALFDLYSHQGMLTKFHTKVRYNRGRLWELEKFIPVQGTIVDMGSGHGVFANLMALSSPKRNIVGVDIAKNKIEIAKNTIQNRDNIRFLLGDISDFTFEFQIDAITLIDTLYLIPFDIQRMILAKAYGYLKKRGILLINNICKVKRFRFYKAVLQEKIAVNLLKITSGKDFYFRTNEEWQDLLKGMGFSLRVIPRETSNPAILYICQKS